METTKIVLLSFLALIFLISGLSKASGNEKVARAELTARNKPSEDASYKVRVAKATGNVIEG